ncbi:MAG: HEAT repeat domain-containing protein [Victivallales bacterium]|nr:HEAT repeat domain-containing protein [Victivallales bacterium]
MTNHLTTFILLIPLWLSLTQRALAASGSPAPCFPLWFTLTQQAPLTLSQVSVHGNRELSANSATVLQAGYGQLTMAERAKVAYEIRKDTSGRAQALLLKWLEQETDPYLQGAILGALRDTSLDAIPEKAIRPFLAADNAHVQNAAMRLYGLLPAADFACLESLCRKSLNPGFKVALFEILPRRQDTAFKAFPVELLLENKDSVDLTVASAALRAALSAPGNRNSEVDHWQALAAEDKHVVMRMAAASDAHVNNTAIALKLAGDSQATVRMAVFQNYQDGTDDALRRLLRLPADADPAVRTAKVELLCRLPQIRDLPEIHALLLASFADDTLQVREAAEAVLSGENMPRELALSLTADALNSAKDEARLIAYRQIAARQFSELLEDVRARIHAETHPENISAALTAIITLKTPGDAADLAYFQPYTVHRSPYVRAVAAHALGKLQVPGSESTIIRMATEDQSEMVQAYAFEAMGFFPQRVFLPHLEKCFSNRNGDSFAAQARAAACWATPRIRIHPEDEEDVGYIDRIAYSMFYLTTKPTIPEGMGMLVFDRDHVIANAMVATARLIELYPKRDSLVYNGKKMLKKYLETDLGAVQSQDAVPVTESLKDVARQAMQSMAGEECTTAALQPAAIPVTLDNLRPSGD